jgi:hydroxymethylbilane synthase
MSNLIRIGTRGSELALWQANFVKSELEKQGIQVELVIIKTQGDQIQHLSLDKLEGKGFFTKEIEQALLQNEVDIAVHSHKDLETEQPFGLTIAAVSARAAASELLLIHPNAIDKSKKWSFKEGAVVGTSSSRRKSQVLHHRPDITLKDIRGNVPTRVNKLRQGEFDAILLAKAGVDRLALDLSDVLAIELPATEFVPAPAQGVLALQCRSNDQRVIDILAHLNHKDVQRTISIERGVLNKMKGGCHLPLGVFAEERNQEYTVRVSYAKTWDAPVRYITFKSDHFEKLADQIVDSLMN